MTAIWIVLSLFGYKAFAMDSADLVGYVSDVTQSPLFEFSDDDDDDPLGLHVLEDPPGECDEPPTDASFPSYPPISPSALSFLFGSQQDLSVSFSKSDLSRSRILSASSTLCSPLEGEEGDDDETELEKIGSLYDLFQIMNDASDTFQNRVDAATLAFVKGNDFQKSDAAKVLFALAQNKAFDAEDRSDALKILLRKGTQSQQARASEISMELAAEMFEME